MIPPHYKLKEQVKLLCPLPSKQCGTLQIIGIHRQEPGGMAPKLGRTLRPACIGRA